MGLFSGLANLPPMQPNRDLYRMADDDLRLELRDAVLAGLGHHIASWAGIALTLDEADWLLMALPTLHDAQFKTMRPMGLA